jgi:hypothetical protein
MSPHDCDKFAGVLDWAGCPWGCDRHTISSQHVTQVLLPSTFSFWSLNSVIGGNFSSQARIAAPPLTAGSLGGLITASSRNRAAQVAKSLARAAFIATCVMSSMFLRSAAERLFPVCPSEDSDIRNPAITGNNGKARLRSINFMTWGELCLTTRHFGSAINQETKLPPRNHSFRSASLNAMIRPTLPIESKMRISPDRKQARFCG